MKKKRILVALQSFSEYDAKPLETLQSSGHDIIFNDRGHRLDRDEIIELGKDCDGVIAGVEPYDEKVLSALPKLKCISRCGAGTDNIDAQTAARNGVTVLNTPDVVIRPVAEMTLAMILDLLRNLTLQTTHIRGGQWKKCAGHLLEGRKVGVVGLGRIGRKVAELLNLLGADVYGNDLYPQEVWAADNRVKLLSLDRVLETVDVLTIHVCLDKENCLVIGKSELGRMKKGSILINTARGSLIDENALYEALHTGRLAGAALDVFGKEPYSGPLAGLDNVVLTPHVSTLTEESRSRMELESAVNILGYFNRT